MVLSRRIDAFTLWCWRRLLRVPWTARRSNQSILKRSVLNVHWKDWCWSWNSNTLATSCEEWTHWKRPSCWERLGAGGEGDDRGWDGCMASLTRWTWVWVNSGSWWWTGKPDMLRLMGSQRVGHDWVTELNWTEKMMLWKCFTQYASKFGKLSSGHRTAKDQFSFQSQRKAMPKNVQTTAQLHSSHTLAK